MSVAPLRCLQEGPLLRRTPQRYPDVQRDALHDLRGRVRERACLMETTRRLLSSVGNGSGFRCALLKPDERENEAVPLSRIASKRYEAGMGVRDHSNSCGCTG